MALIAVAIGAVLWVRDEGPPPELSMPRAEAPQAAPTTGAGDQEVYVQAAGAVRRPGVYRLAPGARVIDLLDAAGGPAPGAAPEQLNLAARLADGERVYVPRVGEVVPAAPASSAGGGEGNGGDMGAPVNLNTADAAELETLPGVGPTTAAAIIEHRERDGPFTSVDDLLDVRGIGEAKLEALRDHVTV